MKKTLLTLIIIGLCKNTSAGKSLSKTLTKNSQECSKAEGWGGLVRELAIDSRTYRSGPISGCHFNK